MSIHQRTSNALYIMTIAIINTLPVPSGNASVNRLMAYAKDLSDYGHEVTILSSASFENSEVKPGLRIISCGRSRSRIGALSFLLKKVRKGRFDVAILVSNSLLLIYPLWLTCRLCHIKFVQEKSEFPFVLMKGGSLCKSYASFYVNTTYRLFDGMIVMTPALMEYFSGKVRKSCKLFEMPMTVDSSRFNIPKTELQHARYIAYCGNMAGNKDGVKNLIHAFNLAAEQVPEINLLLIGGSSNSLDWEAIVSEVESTGKERITLYGEASPDEIPSLLKNADALALARPSSLQAAGGFPTKLGEYLATGNPVIVTAVGNIPAYLNDSNSFIVPPDRDDLFADAIVRCFEDYPKAQAIGLEGKKLVSEVFDSKIQSERLNKYLKELCG